MSRRCTVVVLFLACALTTQFQATALAAGPPSFGNFGPTGIDIDPVKNQDTLIVTNVQPGSPAEGKLNKGDIIVKINGQAPLAVEDETILFPYRKRLAQFILDAEASDGKLVLDVKPAEGQANKQVTLTIPILGRYSATWPLNCDKTDKIIRSNADALGKRVMADPKKYADHNMYNGMAILFLLSTGEEQDLDVVREIYKTRMADFDPEKEIGSHTWHNGHQGMAVNEYYLRTGDDSVLPLMNAISEAGRKYQVMGGWTHWAKGVNPQYVAGGLLNAAGTHMLTSQLLARQTPAEVDTDKLNESIRYFYRFVGKGSNPYGDHRPEDSLGDNGKNSILAMAMAAAAHAENPELYEQARDMAALSSLYNYPHTLHGHTGPLGSIWFGVSAGMLAEKLPELYRNRMDETQWFYVLSRRHDGMFGASGAQRYDQESFGHAVGLALTAPKKTLQITGAAKSPHAKSFTLPDHKWGRDADLAFFDLQGGEAYEPQGLMPHEEYEAVATATKDELRRFAAHPFYFTRRLAAMNIREKGHDDLIEELLVSDCPQSQHTACLAINIFEPWRQRFSKGNLGQHSIELDKFTPTIFESLMKIINDPDAPLWNVDAALCAVAAASPQQTISVVDELLPWLEHEEWWLREAATIALTPAMNDETAMETILPALTQAIGQNIHARGRGTMTYKMDRATVDASPKIKDMIADAYVEMYRIVPAISSPEPGVDHRGITSFALEGILSMATNTGDPQVILAIAQLSKQRLGDMRDREVTGQMRSLLAAADALNPQQQNQLGEILYTAYRPSIVGDDPVALARQMRQDTDRAAGTMNQLIAIDKMLGKSKGWHVIGEDPTSQDKWMTTAEPSSKLDPGKATRFREVSLPPRLKNWFAVDYNPADHGWVRDRHQLTTPLPTYYDTKPWLEMHGKDAKELTFVRKTLELENLDYDAFRIGVFTRQGYHLYLNGHLIRTEEGRTKPSVVRMLYLDDKLKQHLKPGKNVIAVQSFLEYFRGQNGMLDVYLEGLENFPDVAATGSARAD